MSEIRVILCMGMGVDRAGHDHALAARRAVEDALSRTALPVLSGRDPRIVVSLGVQRPEAVAEAGIAALFDGPVEVRAGLGGLDIPEPPCAVAQAAVEIFLPGSGA